MVTYPLSLVISLLMASSVAAGFIVFPFPRFWAVRLNSSSRLKRFGTLLLYCQASFLLAFSVAAVLHHWLLRVASLNTLFMSVPWQVRLLSFLVLLVPLWLFVFLGLLQYIRTLIVQSRDS